MYLPTRTQINSQIDLFYRFIEKIHTDNRQKIVNFYNASAITFGPYNKYMTDKIYTVIGSDGNVVVAICMNEDTPISFFESNEIAEKYPDIVSAAKRFISFDEDGHMFDIIAYRHDAFESVEGAFDVYDLIYGSIVTIDDRPNNYTAIIPQKLVILNALIKYGYITIANYLDYEELFNIFRQLPKMIFSSSCELELDLSKLFVVLLNLKPNYPSMLRDYYSCFKFVETSDKHEE